MYIKLSNCLGQQREQLLSMERRVTSSVSEADATEAKVELMEGVIRKLKIGCEEVYLMSQCGSTPVLSLLGGRVGTDRHDDRPPERPFVTENNIIMYLDMIHERLIELKCVAQFVDSQKGGKPEPEIYTGRRGSFKSGQALLVADPVSKKGMKRMPSSAALLGKAEEEDEDESDEFSSADRKPFEMAALKARAFRVTRKERKDDINLELETEMILPTPTASGKKGAAK